MRRVVSRWCAVHVPRKHFSKFSQLGFREGSFGDDFECSNTRVEQKQVGGLFKPRVCRPLRFALAAGVLGLYAIRSRQHAIFQCKVWHLCKTTPDSNRTNHKRPYKKTNSYQEL